MSVSTMKMTAMAAPLLVAATAASPTTTELEFDPLAAFTSSGHAFYDSHATAFSEQRLSFGFYREETTQTSFASSFFQESYISQIITETRIAQQEAARQQAALIAETHFMSAPNSDDRVFVTIRPEGLEAEAQPLTFDHVSGPVGIIEERADNGTTSRYVFAAVGINTNNIVMTQKTEDPRGVYPIDAQVPMSNPDILKSENSRAAVAFTPEMGAIQEFQFVLPHNADLDEDITISLKGANGVVTQVIDAKKYQIVPANQSRFANVAETGDVPSFLVLVIQNDAENLASIYNTMLENGSFEVQAMSIGEKTGIPNGRLVPSPVAFGPDMAEHLTEAYAQLPNPDFHFLKPTRDVQRLYSYDPQSEPVDHSVNACPFLMLPADPAERKNIRVFNAIVEGGTGVRPRDFEKGYVAVDEFNNLVAAGSAAWLGSNVATQTARFSGSAPTGFVTEGGELYSGCTDDNIVTWSVPVTPTPYTSITTGTGYTSLFARTTTGIRTTGFFTGITTTGTITPLPETPSQVPIPPAGMLLAGALGSMWQRRRLASAFSQATSSIIDRAKSAAVSFIKNPIGFMSNGARSIGLG